MRPLCSDGTAPMARMPFAFLMSVQALLSSSQALEALLYLVMFFLQGSPSRTPWAVNGSIGASIHISARGHRGNEQIDVS